MVRKLTYHVLPSHGRVISDATFSSHCYYFYKLKPHIFLTGSLLCSLANMAVTCSVRITYTSNRGMIVYVPIVKGNVNIKQPK